MLYLLKLLIKLNFYNVKTIKISEFAQWLNEEVSPAPLIIDARSQEEYKVSHIKSAQLIEPDNLFVEEVLEVSFDNPVVVYCSVGYRSAKVAQKLQEIGYKNVFNLSGGMFQWVNQGYPVFQKQQKVEIVHPYNFIWGKLLKSRYHI